MNHFKNYIIFQLIKFFFRLLPSLEYMYLFEKGERNSQGINNYYLIFLKGF